MLLAIKAPIATKVVCFSCLLKCLRSLYDSVDPDQTAPIGAVCSGSTLFVYILNWSVMLGNYLQQTTSADNIFKCIFFLGTLRISIKILCAGPFGLRSFIFLHAFFNFFLVC